MIKSLSHLRSGFTLVETTIATAILAYVMYNFIGAFVNLAHSQVRSLLHFQAADYARESLEIAYNISSNTLDQADAWNTLIRNKSLTPDDYYPVFNPLTHEVTLESGVDVIDSFFQRSLVFYQVCRDPDILSPTYGDIIYSPPPCDLDEKVVRVVSKVRINHTLTHTDIEISSYLINPNSI